MKNLLNNNKIRHILRITIACLITYSLYQYVYSYDIFLMLFATFFVMLTSIGSALFQGILRFFLLVSVVALLYLCVPLFSDIHANLQAVLLGSFVGIVSNVLIFPDKINTEFERTVVPFLKESHRYFSAIVELLLENKSDDIGQAKITLENRLRSLPFWVYRPGFDLALQKGYRYYFMKLNHLAELLFSMHYLARCSYDSEWVALVKNPLLQCVLRMDEFVMGISTLLELKKLKEGVTDFSEDIAEIEILFKQVVAVPLDLLEKHQDFKYFSEFMYDLKELRVALIQLAKALRV